MKLGTLGSFCLALAISSSASAASWAEKMIDTKKIDFGVIATGSDVKKQIEIRNVYDTTVRLAEVKTSCGCAKARALQMSAEPGGVITVEVNMDTLRFRQKKNSFVIMRFSSPQYAEVRVPVEAYIRSDVVFDPGLIRFGNVDQGQAKTAKVSIRYAGRDDWEIVDLRVGNPHLTASKKSLKRSAGRVDYELSVTLDDSMRPGRMRDLVTLVTNDKANPFVPLMVEGMVVSDVTVTPSLVNFSRMRPGSTASRRIVVKGRRPFTIERIDCDGMSDCVEVKVPEGPERVHVVPIQFSAPDNPGAFEGELVIQIAGRTEPLRLKVAGAVN